MKKKLLLLASAVVAAWVFYAGVVKPAERAFNRAADAVRKY